MHLIIIAVVIVSVIGLIAGLGLAVASKVMAVRSTKRPRRFRRRCPAQTAARAASPAAQAMRQLSLRARPPTPTLHARGAEVSKAIAKITGLAAGMSFP